MTNRLTCVFEPLVRHMDLMTEDAIREKFREAMDAFVNQDLYVEHTTRRGGVRTRPRWSADTLIAWSEWVLRAPTKTILMTTITDLVLYLDGRAIRGETITHLRKPAVKLPSEVVTALTVHGELVGTAVGASVLSVYVGDDPPGEPVPAEQVVNTIRRFEGLLTVKVFLLDDQKRNGVISWVSDDEIALFYPESDGYRVISRTALRRAQCGNASQA